MYYHQGVAGGTWQDTRWMGVSLSKCPFDLWVYQEILFELKPDLIIETGTFKGGSALYLGHLCDVLRHGSILSIDIAPIQMPEHPRVEYFVGSSTGAEAISLAQERAKSASTVMVILDSDHSRDHVLRELELYGPLVTKGSYMIVEDTNVNGHPVALSHGPGPMEAIDAFLPTHPEFQIDSSREKFNLSFNPRGFLLRG